MMLYRLVLSALVGIGAAVLATVVYMAGLWAYLWLVFIPAHKGVGAVVGGFNPLLVIVSFVAGFVWTWHRSRGKAHSSDPKADAP